MLQMIEGSTVMDSRVGGILPPVSSHAATKRAINALLAIVDYLTCTCLSLNQSCVANTLLMLNNKNFNAREQNWLHAVMQYISADKLNKLYSFMFPTGSARHRSLLTPLALTMGHVACVEEEECSTHRYSAITRLDRQDSEEH